MAARASNRKSLTPGKAKKILEDGGIKRIGGGFASDKQRRYIGWIAGGRKARTRIHAKRLAY